MYTSCCRLESAASTNLPFQLLTDGTLGGERIGVDLPGPCMGCNSYTMPGRDELFAARLKARRQKLRHERQLLV